MAGHQVDLTSEGWSPICMRIVVAGIDLFIGHGEAHPVNMHHLKLSRIAP